MKENKTEKIFLHSSFTPAFYSIERMEVEEISSGDLKLQLQRLTSELEDKNSIIQQLNDGNQEELHLFKIIK